MKILLIAPSTIGSQQQRLETLPEIRAIVANHQCNLLIESVTKKMIYDAVRQDVYDIIHIASHNDPQTSCIWLNDTECLDKEECAQIARTANATLLFFNGCDSAGIASYMVRHGIKYSIYTTATLSDGDAWKMPNTFYSILERENQSFVDAYVRSDGGEGLYGLVMNPEKIADENIMRREVDEILIQLRRLTRRLKYVYILQFSFIIILIFLGVKWLVN